MAEKEFRQEGENSQSGRDGYKSYNKEGYNKYGRGEKSNSYGRRPYNNNREGGEGYRSSYNPRFNNNNGEDRPQRGGYGNRPQRPYGNRPYNNEGGEQRSSYNPRFNNNNGNRPQRPYGNRPYNNNEGGEQRPYRPRFNNGGQQGGEQRSYRPRFNNSGQQGGYGRPQGGYRPRTADYNPNAKYSMKKQIEYKEVLADPDEPIRLNKFLANAGICSRREADEFITAGVVSVNGEVVTELGTKVKRSDEVKFHDQPVSIERKVYVLLNKPKDCVTTSDDPQERKTVMDFVKGACKERIYPVGRLDRNTTGVLLLTNDGDLASKLTHPKFLKKKIYHVYCDKNVTKADLDQIVQGITLDDGEIHADAVSYASDTDKSQVGIEIHSGKNRIVRRIFESLGYRVVKLDRVYFAGLTKKGLRRGDWRYLTEQEVAMLRMGSFE
ncbi:pseudouridine synthase [Bacteroides mediterraneensis]|uniref:Pseudouridine synthase n=1 Tax=Bacteroides mediterraneensis TaxID=1841856 RepID=A0ABS2ES89_9BACE|nr:pseudouridine synthase [Bacteroides mediterraneensis]MBM6757540.1 RNA-binding S4 domain-containing protein [Bacteroides mediterraneensis]MBM6780400.1 RNA-binding S4 domain-containing protein [Bacteroides mediterraneensis]